MKILYLSTFDNKGGAAKGAYRLHRGFLSHNINSTMFVAKKFSDDPSVMCQSYKKHLWWRTRLKISKNILKLQKSDNPISHSVNLIPSGNLSVINKFSADIVQLHWIGNDFISISEIAKISSPIVWRLADQWAFSGAEHYELLDRSVRYQEGYLSSNRSINHKGIDIDRLVWKNKMKFFHKKPMTIITGSHWLANCVRESQILGNHRVEAIPSGIDISIFKPLDKEFARKALNLPRDKRLILFGAVSATKDPRKGFHHLMATLKLLAEQSKSEDVELVIFGAKESEQVQIPHFKAHYFPHIYDELTLSLFYSASDVFVAPSSQDNLPFSVMEAMACGCPCVAFNIGGLPDLIDHNVNGFLAQPFSHEDLMNGIFTILDDESKILSWGRSARLKAESEYDVNIQVERYIKIYNEILSESN